KGIQDARHNYGGDQAPAVNQAVRQTKDEGQSDHEPEERKVHEEMAAASTTQLRPEALAAYKARSAAASTASGESPSCGKCAIPTLIVTLMASRPMTKASPATRWRICSAFIFKPAGWDRGSKQTNSSPP